ncbi:hypothetical protein BJ742DRAFT_97692 [Cladochytrium replicatum]|nr:hypothetical protein BJ742DRAFT_97692 [Cladochytrium replicatum]
MESGLVFRALAAAMEHLPRAHPTEVFCRERHTQDRRLHWTSGLKQVSVIILAHTEMFHSTRSFAVLWEKILVPANRTIYVTNGMMYDLVDESYLTSAAVNNTTSAQLSSSAISRVVMSTFTNTTSSRSSYSQAFSETPRSIIYTFLKFRVLSGR